MDTLQFLGLLSLHCLSLAHAQGLTQTIWAVFDFNVYGDSTPALLPQARTLTSLGAQELYDVGSAFRDRYILGAALNSSSETSSVDNWIIGLSQYRLDAAEVRIYSTADQFVAASALAFMQGLYPPLAESNGTYLDETYLLANGSVLASPLNDYQYPLIYTASLTDSNSILVAGQVDCPMHQVSKLQYRSSSDFEQVEADSLQYYDHLYEIALYGSVDKNLVGYSNAQDVFEYLQYEYLHNDTLASFLPQADLQRARALANQYVFATNGNLSASGIHDGGFIRAVAGRTLARLILQSFDINIETQGATSKMTTVFGGVEPAVAFAALTQLASPMNSDFYGMPVPGASLVLELYSLNTSLDIQYPDVSDLFVRLLLRNSSSRDAQFVSYPLFGHGPSQIDIPFNEFQAGLGQIILSSTEGWCDTCNSSAIFCNGVVEHSDNPRRNEGLSLAGAGGIGAAVTLATVALIAGIAWLCGFGTNRSHRESRLGGFKGNDKMASDHDVSFANPAGGVFGGSVIDRPENAATKGHERSGSWEMKNKGDGDVQGRTISSFDGDEDDTLGVNPYSVPVKVHETV
jgi:hypothetical protein